MFIQRLEFKSNQKKTNPRITFTISSKPQRASLWRRVRNPYTARPADPIRTRHNDERTSFSLVARHRSICTNVWIDVQIRRWNPSIFSLLVQMFWKGRLTYSVVWLTGVWGLIEIYNLSSFVTENKIPRWRI